MIVYLISSYKGMNTGKGGHYYSLMAISEEVAKYEKVLIVNIGNFKAPALDNFKQQKIVYVHSSFYNTFITFKKLMNLLKDEEIKAIHSFDKHSILFGRFLSIKYNVPLISTKCGGPSYDMKSNIVARYFPKIKNQTVFHQKDLDFFKDLNSIKNIHLIPGRVKSDVAEIKISHEIEAFFKNAEVKIMRICRIGFFYFETTTATINFLVKRLEFNQKSKLIIIGHVENEKVLKQLNDIIASMGLSQKILILTDQYHVIEASKFLHYPNVVLGTGRSFMEAAAYGHVMLAPVKGSEMPAVVTGNNIEFFESNNFSIRTPKNKKTDYFNNEDEWNKIFYDETIKNEYKKFLRQRFDKIYSINSAVKKYLELYSINQDNENMCLDIFKHLLFFKLSLFKASILNGFRR